MKQVAESVELDPSQKSQLADFVHVGSYLYASTTEHAEVFSPSWTSREQHE